MSKYDALCDHLKNLTADKWLASFDEIEAVLGFELPKSAENYQAWWNEERHPHQPQKLAVRRAGWQVAQINLTAERILFQREIRESAARNVKSSRRRTEPDTQEATKRDIEPEAQVDVHFAWERLGTVTLDHEQKLRFPKAPAIPGIYRFQLGNHSSPSVYIGEADNLGRRFQHYRTPGPSQQTNKRLAKLMVDGLRGGNHVSVSIITEGALIRIDGEKHVVNLRHKAERVLVEHAALIVVYRSEAAVLNR